MMLLNDAKNLLKIILGFNSTLVVIHYFVISIQSDFIIGYPHSVEFLFDKL